MPKKRPNFFKRLLGLFQRHHRTYTEKRHKEQQVQAEKKLWEQYPDGILEREVQGSRMTLDLHDHGISRELALTGVHEPVSTEFIKGEIKPGMNVVEVGANIGYYALIKAKLVGSEGHVYAFEPNPDNFKSLEKNIALNKYEDRFSLFPHAIGFQSGEVDFHLADRGNLSTMIKREDDGVTNYKTVRVPVISLDRAMGDKEVNYVRMDVEGYEAEILKGMRQILNSRSLQGMFIEVHSQLLHKLGFEALYLVRNLERHGYVIKRAFYRGRKDVSVSSTEEFYNHPLREEGYWETFFTRKQSN